MPHAMEHCHRPWWKRPPVWFIVIAVVAMLSVAVVNHTDQAPAMPYSTFLDQLDAGNVASVTFQGTEFSGRLKRPLQGSPSGGGVYGDAFISRVPDVGDSTLIPALRKLHVTIDVTSPSGWSWLLGHTPWPMLAVIGAALLLAFFRLVRGGQAQSGTAASALATHGLPGLLSRLFSKPHPGENPPPRDGDEPKSR